MICKYFFLFWGLSFQFFKKDFIYLFLEGKGRRKRGRETSIVVASCMPTTGDLPYNPDMCPDWELNRQPFGSQAGTQSTEPHQPGLNVLFCLFVFLDFIYLFLGIGEGREKEGERNTDHPQPRTSSASQVCALTRNRTSDLLVCEMTWIHWATRAVRALFTFWVVIWNTKVSKFEVQFIFSFVYAFSAIAKKHFLM